MQTPRIAYCSPVNPAPSGISDYSEELLPYLGQYADIVLFVEDGLRPANRRLVQHLEVLPLRRLPRELRRRRYDALVYHMGNSPAHGAIWDAARRLPGVVVLHDFVLHHFMLWYAASRLRDVQSYVRAMEARYGASGAHMARLMIRSRFTDAAFDFPCCEPVLASARGLIAHSRYVAGRAAALRPDLPVAVVPMGVPLPNLPPREAARARLGLPPEAVVLASFGHINAWKRVEPTLRALAALRAEGRDARYLLVGSVSPNYDLAGLIARSGLGDVVTVTGYVPRAAFENYVAAADICVNLRYPTAGETSASLLRLLGAGRPTLVSAVGAFAELPPGVAAQVDPGPAEGDQILAYCRLLLARPELAAALGAQARAYVAAEHTLERAAAGYARFLARLYGWPVVRKIRPAPLWFPLPEEGEPDNLAVSPTLPPAAPTPPAATSPLVASAARALAEIGLTGEDTGILSNVARRIAELS
ncbi:MAG: glycosyltransferase family 4 protein [Oscillochloridaceae bacterium]|nr:glycosyltransferase family 4 protein [Chloroflexaceae bacterium]MDW8391796.1 glycosyltransferase family 4 protein [Oscillochloridaceae bacterium]